MYIEKLNKQVKGGRKMAKSSTGMEENIAALLCYLFGVITGIIFFVLEKDSEFVKFHAMQSMITFGAIFILHIGLSFVPILGHSVSALLSLVSFVLWVICMFKAFKGERFKLPVVGDLAEQQLNKSNG